MKTPGRITVNTTIVFPGLGADYPQMVSRFTGRFPEARETLADWSRLLDAPLGADPPLADERRRERLRQLEIHALNLLWWRQVEQAYPDAVFCGHSLGFYAALVAAGVVDEQTSFRLIDLVFDLCWAAFGSRRQPVAVLTVRNTIDSRWLAAKGAEVLCINCPRQVVVFAPQPVLEAIAAELGDELLRINPLGSQPPFHSRSMEGVSWAISKRLARDDWAFHKPSRPLWTHIEARPLTGWDDAMAQVIEQPHRPVRWQQTVQALVATGRRRFVEVGPNRIIGQILRWIEPGLDVKCVDNLRK